MVTPTAKIAITGATGLIGSHVLYRFCKENISIRALTRDPNQARNRIREFFSYYSDQPETLMKNIEFFQADITDLNALDLSLEGIENIIHCAGIVSDSKKDRKIMMKINGTATADIVNLALEKNTKWFCYISSVAVFGGRTEEEIDETLFWKSAPRISDYAISKYSGEREVWRAMEEGLPAVILNPSVVVGPAKENKQMNRFLKFIRKELPNYIEGESNYVDARDVAEIVYRLYLDQTSGDRFIVSAENLSTKELISYATNVLGLKEPKKALSGWKLSFLRMFYPTLIRSVQSAKHYSNKKITDTLGFTFRPIKEAIENTLGKMK